MTWFIPVFGYYGNFFVQYVLPFAGLGIILYTIYLIKYIIGGKH